MPDFLHDAERIELRQPAFLAVVYRTNTGDSIPIDEVSLSVFFNMHIQVGIHPCKY